MRVCYIYTLSDPLTEEIRYVGKTSQPLRRAYEHSYLRREENTHKKNWISKLKKKGNAPLFEIIDEVDIEEWQFWEKYWVSQIRSWGYNNLLNHTNGGDGSTFGNKGSFTKGRAPWNKGMKGRKLKSDKHVFQYSGLTGNFLREWSTAKKAGSELNINVEGIGQCCRGKIRSAGGYVWEYSLKETVKIVEYIGKTNNLIRNKLK